MDYINIYFFKLNLFPPIYKKVIAFHLYLSYTIRILKDFFRGSNAARKITVLSVIAEIHEIHCLYFTESITI